MTEWYLLNMQRLVQTEKGGALFPYPGVRRVVSWVPRTFYPKVYQSITGRAVGRLSIEASHSSGKYQLGAMEL